MDHNPKGPQKLRKSIYKRTFNVPRHSWSGPVPFCFLILWISTVSAIKDPRYVLSANQLLDHLGALFWQQITMISVWQGSLTIDRQRITSVKYSWRCLRPTLSLSKILSPSCGRIAMGEQPYCDSAMAKTSYCAHSAASCSWWAAKIG